MKPPETPINEAPRVPPADNTTSPLKFRVAVALTSGVEACYSAELARAFALAQLSGADAVIEADAFEAKLKDKYQGELNLQRFRRAIKVIRQEMSRAVAMDGDGHGYMRTSEGGLVANLANAITMLKELPLQYNSFTCRAFLTEESPWGTRGDWRDFDDVKAAEWCQRKSLNVEIRTVSAAVDAVARGRTPHYNPVLEYLGALEWDETERISHWLQDYLGVPDSNYARAVSRKWLIACCKRVTHPGCQSDYTLVLEGAQGRRKSTALRTLGGDWFTDDVAEIGTKDSAMQLQGKWIVEVSELDAFRRAEMTTVKAWLVRREDHFRPPYGRRTEDFPRQNVFAASTNQDTWGQDDSGLRRFWPVRTGDIDIAGLSAARDQLWAEAYHACINGETSYLDENTEIVAAGEQHERQTTDIWEDSVTAWIDRPLSRTAGVSLMSLPGRAYLNEVMEHCLGKPEKDRNHADKCRVTRILRLAGWVADRETVNMAAEYGRTKRIEFWKRMKGE